MADLILCVVNSKVGPSLSINEKQKCKFGWLLTRLGVQLFFSTIHIESKFYHFF